MKGSAYKAFYQGDFIQVRSPSGQLVCEVSCAQVAYDIVYSISSTAPLSVSPDGTMLAITYEYGIVLWNLKSNNYLWQINQPIHAITFSFDSKLIAVSYGNIIRIVTTGGAEKDKFHCENKILGIEFSPDSNFIIGSTNDHTQIWDVKQGEFVHDLHGFVHPVQVSYQCDELHSFIILSDATKTIFWDAKLVHKEITIQVSLLVEKFLLQKNDSVIGCLLSDGTVKVFDIDSSKELLCCDKGIEW
jgi:WD40 repeat protein